MWLTTTIRSMTTEWKPLFAGSMRQVAGGTLSGSAHNDTSAVDPAERVVLVNEADIRIGTAEKRDVHETGRLHRAFSVFLIDERGRHLLQRRADHKYHSGGLWSNACCSHPRPGEAVGDAVRRRLHEELGVRADVTPAFHMRYRAPMPNGLVEHEYDHVFVGRVDSSIERHLAPDKSEVAEAEFVEHADIDGRLRTDADSFTRWFRLAWPEIVQYMESGGRGVARSIFCPDGAVATFMYPEGPPAVSRFDVSRTGD